MTIFTDNENRVVKSGVNEYEILDTHPLAKMSETKKLCYVYKEDGSFYPYVSTDIIEKLEEIHTDTEPIGVILGANETDDKLQLSDQFRKAVNIFAQTLPEESAMEISGVYDEWKPNTTYQADTYITYGLNEVGDKQLYKVVSPHVSQSDWIPDKVPALYTPIGIDESGYPIWSQPTGAHDAYNKGDIVMYNDTLYISTIDGNIWSPDTYPAGWDVYNG